MCLRNELVQILIEVGEPEPIHTTNVSIVLIWYRVMHRFSAVLDSEDIYELFAHCVEKHRKDFPWLPNSLQGSSSDYLFLAFEDAILGRSSRDAEVVTRALLGTYIDLLTQRVGETLTVNLVCNIASKR